MRNCDVIDGYMRHGDVMFRHTYGTFFCVSLLVPLSHMLAAEPDNSENQPIILDSQERWFSRSWVSRNKFMTLVIGLILVVAVLGILLVIFIGLGSVEKKKVDPLTVKVENIMGHLQELFNIAMNSSNGTRAIGTPGFNLTGEYILSKLRSAGYSPVVQYFPYTGYPIITGTPQFSMTSTLSINYTYLVDFTPALYSVGGTVSGNLFLVKNFGCSLTDYDGLSNGGIPLIMSGGDNCTNSLKINTSLATGMNPVAIVIWNANSAVATPISVRAQWAVSQSSNVPVIGCSSAVGQFFSKVLQNSDSTISVSFSAQISVPNVTVFNILAETSQGDPNQVIVVGSHFDSVPAGPGMNDNGSGTSSTLEIALQSARQKVQWKHKVRFSWWAAEELGLIGSSYYVSSLNETERKRIALNLNFDMLGSPNFQRATFNASSGPLNVQNASVIIQRVFEEHFRENLLAWNVTAFDGRSDYGPFIAVGIPAGGLATGAEKIKSGYDRRLYGGVQNVAYDPCYHQSCDTLDNINQNVLSEMAIAAAHTVYQFGTDEKLMNTVQQFRS